MRRIIVFSVAAYLAVVVVLSLSSRKWTGDLEVPAGVAYKTVTYTCGPAWGANYIHAPKPFAYVVVGKPCSDRHQARVTSVVDVVVSVFVIALVEGRPLRNAMTRRRLAESV